MKSLLKKFNYDKIIPLSELKQGDIVRCLLDGQPYSKVYKITAVGTICIWSVDLEKNEGGWMGSPYSDTEVYLIDNEPVTVDEHIVAEKFAISVFRVSYP